MQLSEIREKFIELSGRYDFEGNTKSHFYINAGVRLLDRMSRFSHSSARSFRKVPAGARAIVLSDCNDVETVFVQRVDSRTQITYLDEELFRELYPQAPSNRPTGDLTCFTVTSLRHSPELLDVNADDFEVPADMAVVAPDYYNRLLMSFGPALQEELVLEIKGAFYSRHMTEDSDKNIWSVQFPDLLLKAALYQLEVSYRNTEGARDWMAAISLDIDNLDKDSLEPRVRDINQMEG